MMHSCAICITAICSMSYAATIPNPNPIDNILVIEPSSMDGPVNDFYNYGTVQDYGFNGGDLSFN